MGAPGASSRSGTTTACSHDTGSGLFEAGPVAADRGARGASGERRPAAQSARRRSARARSPETSRGVRRRSRRTPSCSPCTRRRTSRRSTRSRSRRRRERRGPDLGVGRTPRAARRRGGRGARGRRRRGRRRRRVAFALTRPPGHHCGPETIDGYCFFSNAALAARRLRDRGAERVAVVDWDVHHGNGTRGVLLGATASVLTISVHMDHRAWGAQPPPGRASPPSAERTRAWARTSTCRCRSAPATGRTPTRWTASSLPALREFRPDAIVCAQGTDASQFDPNGRMCVSMPGSTRSASPSAGRRRTRDRRARRHPGGRLRADLRCCGHRRHAARAARSPERGRRSDCVPAGRE